MTKPLRTDFYVKQDEKRIYHLVLA